MSRLSRLIKEQSKSLTEQDAQRVLDFINALNVTSPRSGDSAPATIRRDGAAPPDLDGHGPIPGTAAAALALLATARFSSGPVGAADEIEQRIEALRDDWDRD